MRTYLPRIVDHELDELLGSLAAVAIEGAKAVGKTETAKRRARTVHQLDLPATMAIASADPTVLLGDPAPVLLDEWQRTPAIWDAVRREVDRDSAPGRFLLTGSAAPPDAPTHSGAGRIVQVRMRPLALAERALAEPTVSLATMLRAGSGMRIQGRTTVGLADYAREIVSSGFPDIRGLSGRALSAQLDGYLRRIVDRDFEDQGHVVRRPETLRRWMTAYAAATATTASLEKIRTAAAVSGGDEIPAKTTANAYRTVLERLWMIDPVPGWLPSRNQLARLTQAPKHHLADPALAARLLGMDADALLKGAPWGAGMLPIPSRREQPRHGALLGQLFESLVTQSLQVYAQAAEARVHHLRTYDGRREVDLLVETNDQRVVAFEVKTTAAVADDDVRHLLWLRDQLGDRLADLAVLTTGTHAYRRPDGVAVVPAVLLGP